MTTLIQAAFCVALVVSGAKTQTQRVEPEEETTPTNLATTTQSPVTDNELATTVQNVPSTTKASEEETTTSTTTPSTSRQTTAPTTSQSSAPTTKTSVQTTTSKPESTKTPQSLASGDQPTSRPSPYPVTSWPTFVAKPDTKHPNAVSADSQGYQGKNDFSNFVNTAEFRKNVYNQLYRRMQQEQEQYLQSLLFSGLFFDI